MLQSGISAIFFSFKHISVNVERHNPEPRACLQLSLPSERMPKCTAGDPCLCFFPFPAPLSFFPCPGMLCTVKYLNYDITEKYH